MPSFILTLFAFFSLSYLAASASLLLELATGSLSSNIGKTLNASRPSYGIPFQIPGSTVWIRLEPAPGTLSPSLNYVDVDSLLLIASAEVGEMIRERGHTAWIDKGPNNNQRFRETRNALELFIIGRNRDDGAPFQGITWGNLGDVIKGLEMAMLEQRMLREAYFLFWDDDKHRGSTSGRHDRSDYIGLGSVKWVGSAPRATS